MLASTGGIAAQLLGQQSAQVSTVLEASAGARGSLPGGRDPYTCHALIFLAQLLTGGAVALLSWRSIRQATTRL